MVCALVRGSTGDVRRGWYGQKSLIFMHFHGVFLGSQHEIWSKQHNGKVSILKKIGLTESTWEDARVKYEKLSASGI
jgi:hypothetical protein